MDSLTHIVLGAAIGEVTLGKKLGNKALAYGAILGSIPDFDVFFSPLYSPVSSLFFHRGFSHSLLFVSIIALAIGYGLSLVEKKHLIGLKSWILLALLPLLSHIFIDCFNTYGTGIFEPFSHIRVAYDSIAIIDLVLLAPLTIAVIWSLFYNYRNNQRRVITWIGLGLSTIYLSLTIVNKAHVESIAKEQLAEQNISHKRLLTTPVPLTNLLWLVVAENETGFNVGYYGNFKKVDDINFRFIAKNSELLSTIAPAKEINELVRFTKGYFKVEKKPDGSLFLYDLRYASLDIESKEAYVFTFKINETANGIEISRSHPNRSINTRNLMNYFGQIFN